MFIEATRRLHLLLIPSQSTRHHVAKMFPQAALCVLLAFGHSSLVAEPPGPAATNLVSKDSVEEVTNTQKESDVLPQPHATQDDVSMTVGPKPTLQRRIDAAVPSDVISLESGAYSENLTIRKSITIVGTGTNLTFLSGQGPGPVITILEGSAVTLTNITIHSGRVWTNQIAQSIYGGAGIHNSGLLTLESCSIISNRSDTVGGAILNYGDLSANRCTFANNSGLQGGAIYNAGLLKLNNSWIARNTCPFDSSDPERGVGGGIYNSGGAVFLHNTWVVENQSWDSGGIYNEGTLLATNSVCSTNRGEGVAGLHNRGFAVLDSTVLKRNWSRRSVGGIKNAQGVLKLLRATLSENGTDPYGYGEPGGLHNESGDVEIVGSLIERNATAEGDVGDILNRGSMIIRGSAIIRNGADFAGGAILNRATFLITDSEISENEGEHFGGIANYRDLILTNCTISGNSAISTYVSSCAGALLNFGESSLHHVTVVENECYIYGNDQNRLLAGGIANLKDLRLGNSLCANNFFSRPWDPAARHPDFSGPITSLDFNLIRDTNGCIITGQAAHNILGPDPKIGQLANNGGPTRTHALLPGSPAIDAGSRGETAFDQRGKPRPSDVSMVNNTADGADIGAYEYTETDGNGALTLTLSNHVSRLSIATARGKNYSIDRRDALGEKEWISVTNNVPGTGWLLDLIETDLHQHPQQFYRVRSTSDPAPP
jgi:hypothetical protein